MIPIRQTVHLVDMDEGICMVISGKGTIYPVDLNHYCKEINKGDTAIVTKSLSGEWLLVDVEPKYPRPLDVTEFPRDENNCLNVVQHFKYLEVIEGMTESERVDYDNHLLQVFIDDYGMKNSLKHRLGQFGYDTYGDEASTVEPNSTILKLEDFL